MNLELTESSCGGCFEPVIFSPLAGDWWHRETGAKTCGYWRTKDGAGHSTGKLAFVPWSDPAAKPLVDIQRIMRSYSIDPAPWASGRTRSSSSTGASWATRRSTRRSRTGSTPLQRPSGNETLPDVANQAHRPLKRRS